MEPRQAAEGRPLPLASHVRVLPRVVESVKGKRFLFLCHSAAYGFLGVFLVAELDFICLRAALIAGVLFWGSRHSSTLRVVSGYFVLKTSMLLSWYDIAAATVRPMGVRTVLSFPP